MSLLEEARAQQRGKGSVCTVGDAIAKDESGELGEAVAAVKAGDLESTALERALVARNQRIPASTIRRHCRGECQCNDAA